MENKIPVVNNLAAKADFNYKITEVENKIPSISGLVTNSALTAVENKIPDISGLVTKTNYNTKNSEIEKKVSDHNHDKYITAPEFNALFARVFEGKLNLANLITKTNLDFELKKVSDRVTSNKTKHLFIESELKKLSNFDAANFRQQIYFDDGVIQNYLVFQPIKRCFKKIIKLKIFHHGNPKDCVLKDCVLKSATINSKISYYKQ